MSVKRTLGHWQPEGHFELVDAPRFRGDWERELLSARSYRSLRVRFGGACRDLVAQGLVSASPMPT